MAYEHLTLVANDGDLQQRLIACAAQEGVENPEQWVTERRWTWATQPGWADAYHSAINTFIDRPGLRPGAIQDEMILAAVQAVKAAETPTP